MCNFIQKWKLPTTNEFGVLTKVMIFIGKYDGMSAHGNCWESIHIHIHIHTRHGRIHAVGGLYRHRRRSKIRWSFRWPRIKNNFAYSKIQPLTQYSFWISAQWKKNQRMLMFPFFSLLFHSRSPLILIDLSSSQTNWIFVNFNENRFFF